VRSLPRPRSLRRMDARRRFLCGSPSVDFLLVRMYSREWLSGIGGQMINIRRTLVMSESSPEPERKKVRSGADDMRAAADLVLQNNCMEIAAGLAKNSMEGHIQSSKFLYDLADENQKLGGSEIHERLHTLASELEAEPQWHEESSEETAESTGGSREPEG
jgi:hypothetical protein